MPPPNYHQNEWPLRILKVKEAWGLPLLNSPESKSMGEGIMIAHPDTGWTEHPELLKGDRYWRDIHLSKNFFGKLAQHLTAEDTLSGMHASHGTTTASLMLSEEDHPSLNPPNNDYPNYTVPTNQFVTGIAPKAEVVPLRVTDIVVLGSGHATQHGQFVNTYSSLTSSIYYALSLNTEILGVMSISLGGLRSPGYLNEALKNARQLGVVVCAAAGQAFNTRGLKKPIFPGRSDHTLCVAGCTETFDQPSEGFYGSQVDITTPGWGVIIARTTGDTPTIAHPDPPRNFIIDPNGDGTSYSTALTAGACALWQAYHGRMNLIRTFGRPFILDVFRYCLANSVFIPPGWDSLNRGMGVMDVKALLECQLPSVNTAEIVANSNNWPESEWGDPTNWGRV